MAGGIVVCIHLISRDANDFSAAHQHGTIGIITCLLCRPGFLNCDLHKFVHENLLFYASPLTINPSKAPLATSYLSLKKQSPPSITKIHSSFQSVPVSEQKKFP